MKPNFPFVRWYNLNGEDDQAVFARQIQAFLKFVWLGLQQHHAPGAVLKDAWGLFNLKCHLFEWLARRAEVDDLEERLAVREIKYGCLVVGQMLRGNHKRARTKLLRWNSVYHNSSRTGFMQRLWLARCDEHELRGFDELGWFCFAQTGKALGCYDHEAVIKFRSKVSNSGASGDEKDTVRLTESQAQVLARLNRFWQMKMGNSTVAGISGRPIPLIIAPSGTGKSFLVRHFAACRGVPLLSLDSASWLVSGSYQRPVTVSVIHQFVVNTRGAGIIFIDELDKFFGQSDWNRSVSQELLSLLDGGARGFSIFSPEQKAKLSERFLIVGCGTWQHLYQASSRTLGFKADQPFTIEQEVVSNSGIPHELLARFNPNLLVLRPPNVSEFQAWIEDIHEELRIAPPAAPDQLAIAAVASGLNTRWLEGYVSNLLLNPPATAQMDNDYPF